VKQAEGAVTLRESVLVRRILSGDQSAGERLVTEHYARVFRLLRHLTGSIDTSVAISIQQFSIGLFISQCALSRRAAPVPAL